MRVFFLSRGNDFRVASCQKYPQIEIIKKTHTHTHSASRTSQWTSLTRHLHFSGGLAKKNYQILRKHNSNFLWLPTCCFAAAAPADFVAIFAKPNSSRNCAPSSPESKQITTSPEGRRPLASPRRCVWNALLSATSGADVVCDANNLHAAIWTWSNTNKSQIQIIAATYSLGTNRLPVNTTNKLRLPKIGNNQTRINKNIICFINRCWWNRSSMQKLEFKCVSFWLVFSLTVGGTENIKAFFNWINYVFPSGTMCYFVFQFHRKIQKLIGRSTADTH